MTKVCFICGDTYPDAIAFCAKDGSALRAVVHSDDLIGEVFCDRYVVTDLLGEGGMGAVYAARDVRLPQRVAIKVLREQGMADPSIIARFRQEAEAASRINHDRVARVTDFGFMKDGRAYLIMEFVEGRTLKDVVTEGGPMSPADMSRIVFMVAEGLDAAHRLGIVHRDLKPDNVMVLDDAGGGVRVKVLDFGIAKVLEGNDDSAGKTKTGFVIGTPQWMSPEQILGEPLDGRSDVYSLALLAYHMLTGRRPYENSSAEAEMMARLASPPRPLTEFLPSVAWPTGLQELLNRTLSRDVNERPATALLFARELAKVTGSGDSTPTAFDARTNAEATRAPATDGARSGQAAPVDIHASNSASANASKSAATNAAANAATNAASNAATNAATAAAQAKVANTTGVGDETLPRSRTMPIILGAAAVVVLGVIAIFAFNRNSSAPTNVTADSVAPPAVQTASRDSMNRDSGATTASDPTSRAGASSTPNGGAPGTNPGTTGASGAKPPVVARGSAADTGSSSAATRSTTARTAEARTAEARTAEARNAGTGAATNATTTPRTAATGASASQAAAAHKELLQLMDAADTDLNGSDSSRVHARAREFIRQLELLASKLNTATDQGNAHLYTAMSHNALGENAKACASLNRAEPLATESDALRSNVAGWQRLLRCGN